MSEQQNTTEKKPRKQLTPEQKRARLEAEIARKKAQLSALDKKDRKRQTHDKILIGALIFALAAKGYNMLGQLLEFAETYKIAMAEKDKTRLDEINEELEKNKKSEPPEPETPKPEPETPKPEPETPKPEPERPEPEPKTPKAPETTETQKEKAEETQEEKRAAQIAETLKARKPTIIQTQTQGTTVQGMTIEEPEDDFKDA